MTWPSGAGALRSMGDLAKWHLALFGGKVLKPRCIKQMTAPGKLKNGTPFDTAEGTHPPDDQGRHLVWFRPHDRRFGDFQPRIGHSGSIQGFNAMINTIPKASSPSSCSTTPMAAARLPRPP